LTKPNYKPTPVAFGYFYDELNSTGWGRLYIHSNGDLPGYVQSYAAGYLEGALTSIYITNHFINYEALFFSNHTVGDKITHACINYN